MITAAFIDNQVLRQGKMPLDVVLDGMIEDIPIIRDQAELNGENPKVMVDHYEVRLAEWYGVHMCNYKGYGGN